MTEEKQKTDFTDLYKIDVSEHIEKKKNGFAELSYLSWTWAWAELKKRHPDAMYEIERNPETGLPYWKDPETGYIVFTKLTIDGITHEMWLPVMDASNRAMKDHAYQVKTRKGIVTVEQATMMNINKTIMRCLVKNIAMFGLGLYIFAGEDLPEEVEEEPPQKPQQTRREPKQPQTNNLPPKQEKPQSTPQAKPQYATKEQLAYIHEYCGKHNMPDQVIAKHYGHEFLAQLTAEETNDLRTAGPKIVKRYREAVARQQAEAAAGPVEYA